MRVLGWSPCISLDISIKRFHLIILFLLGQSPLASSQRLASGLCRNSEDSHESTALASLPDASGAIDKCPVLAQHAEQGALLSTENVFPGSGFSARTPYVQLERYREGEPSLSGEPECLSLLRSVLFQWSKSGKEAALPPLAQAQRYPRRNNHEASPSQIL